MSTFGNLIMKYICHSNDVLAFICAFIQMPTFFQHKRDCSSHIYLFKPCAAYWTHQEELTRKNDLITLNSAVQRTYTEYAFYLKTLWRQFLVDSWLSYSSLESTLKSTSSQWCGRAVFARSLSSQTHQRFREFHAKENTQWANTWKFMTEEKPVIKSTNTSQHLMVVEKSHLYYQRAGHGWMMECKQVY